MGSCKKWRFEVYNPSESTEWATLFDVDEETLLETHKLIEELNAMDTPIQVRIVHKDYGGDVPYSESKPTLSVD